MKDNNKKDKKIKQKADKMIQKVSKGFISKDYKNSLSENKNWNFYLFGESHYGGACRSALQDSISKNEPDLFFIEIDESNLETYKNTLNHLNNHNHILISLPFRMIEYGKNNLLDSWNQSNNFVKSLVLSITTIILSLIFFPLILISEYSNLKKFTDKNETAISYAIKYSELEGINIKCIDNKEILFNDITNINNLFLLLTAMFISPIYYLFNKNKNSKLYTENRDPIDVRLDIEESISEFSKVPEREKIMSENIIKHLQENKNYKNIYIITGAGHMWCINCNLKIAGIKNKNIHKPGITKKNTPS